MENGVLSHDFKLKEEPWRLFKIMSEFVEGIEALKDIGPAVTVFGSARTNPRHKLYRQSRELGGLLVKAGYAVITGGGGGEMEAANRGAAEAGGVSVGLNIILPDEQKPNKYSNRKAEFTYFFIRKLMFNMHSDAFIVMPGGIGTLDELYEVLTLVQTKRMHRYCPIVLFDSDYWSGLIAWMKGQLLKKKMISSEDMDLLKIVDEPAEAVETIKQCLAACKKE
jgi:uncharacterized protein (TIGR00730 family)